jgi:hypothetical protein
MFCGHHFACTWAEGGVGALWMSTQSKKWSRWETSLVIPCIAIHSVKVSMDKYSDRGKQVMWSSMHSVKSISNVYVVLSAKANLPTLISRCKFVCTWSGGEPLNGRNLLFLSQATLPNSDRFCFIFCVYTVAAPDVPSKRLGIRGPSQHVPSDKRRAFCLLCSNLSQIKGS